MLNPQLDHCGPVAPLAIRSLCVSFLLLGPAAATSLAAGVIVDSHGFESSDVDDPFALGDLAGQNGWVTAGNVGGSTANVQNTVVESGTRGLTVTRAAAANTDRRWFVPTSGYPTQRFVTVDWDMRVEGPSGNATLGQFGPFFGVDTYDADTGVFVLGALGVDATTGDVLFQAQTSGALTETGTVVNFGEWNHFRMVMDFSTDSYRGYFNETLVATSGFVDIGAGLDNFTDADIATFAAAPDAASMALGGTAHFDNFVIRDGLVGDYDIDGDVDAADYQRWKATFGATVTEGHNADGNSNGMVDAADYAVWRNNVGATLFGGAGSGSVISAIAVPEPVSLLPILGAIPIILGRGSWRRLHIAPAR